MKPEQIHLAVTLDNGQVRILTLLTRGHGSVLPDRAVWIGTTGWWERKPTHEVLIMEVDRTFPPVDREGNRLPVAASFRLIGSHDFPTDTTFRAAWCDLGTVVAVDMAKAREVQRNRIRRARAPLLAQLDGEVQRADEDGDADARQRAIERKRQLRDAPADPAIDAAQTPDELKAAWPKSLEER